MMTHVCQVMSQVGIECENGGICHGDLMAGDLCRCPSGYTGMFCESMAPGMHKSWLLFRNYETNLYYI